MSGQAFKVEEANTYIRIFDYNEETLLALRRFRVKTLARWKKVQGDVKGTSKYEIDHIFASFSSDKKELRMVKGFYSELLSYLRSINHKGIDNIVPVKLPFYEPVKVEFEWLNGEVKPRTDEQQEYLDYAVDEDRNLVIINGRTGFGKALINSTPVQTPTGWTKICNLSIGDEVIAKDGTVTTVTGVFPQGSIPFNKVTFSDGRVSWCCDEHLWSVLDEGNVENGYVTTKTSDIKERLANQSKFSIPLVTPYDNEEKHLPMSPYEFGQSLIREKDYIPEWYMNGSIAQRKELLRGLVEDRTYYHTTSRSMVRDVVKLVRSLGGLATSSNRELDGHLIYQVDITYPTEGLRLGIVSIEPVGEAECTCISVDHPDKLFVVDDYVVTHNTAVAIMSFVKLGYRVLITVLPRYISIWVSEFQKFLKIKPEDVLDMSIHSVVDVYNSFKEGTLNPKIIFFSLTKIDAYRRKIAILGEDAVPSLDEVFKVMGVGVRIIDEAHDSIYSVYCSLLHGNVKKVMALSATLKCDDDFTNKIYDKTFPLENYLKPPTYEKYLNVVSYYHRINVKQHRINSKGFNGYSHVLYEQSILRRGYVFEQYYRMCKGAFESFYIKNKRPGQKAMFFFSTVEMCNRFSNRLKKDYPDLDIFVFTGEISKKKGMSLEYKNHEVVITTPTSCSTGKDIEKLYIVFAGVSVNSMQRIDQMSGRTRPIDKWWPDLDPIFLTFVCKDVGKQMEYDRKKKSIIGKKTKKFTHVNSNHYF